MAPPFPDVETWASHYVQTTSLQDKLNPPPPPERFRDGAVPVRIAQPGRPPELRPAPRGERLPRPEALHRPLYRARALHAFLHHELQAAELMCWALLAFADAEVEFRRGLLRICLDEIRHMNAYRGHIETLGASVGEFGVRDWFWKRVPSCPSKVSFVAVMGMGLEAANLEYAPTFAARFRAVGDTVGAEIQERIAHEELSHVKFATQWFTHWTGGCDFDTWLSHLPPPWSPLVLRGDPLAIDDRRRAGMPEAFLQALAAYVPEPRGRVAGPTE